MIDGGEAEVFVVAAEDSDSVVRIRRGLDQAKKGMGRSVDEVFADNESEV